MTQGRRVIGLLAAAAAVVLSQGRPAAAHDHWREVAPFFAPTPGKAKVYLWLGEQGGERRSCLRQRRRVA